MSTAARLTPASYTVLGVIALRGPTTSYELKAYVAESIRYIWPLPHAQLYKEPQRLVGLGLLHADSERDGRRRRFFAITDAGRDTLRAWLADAGSGPSELRDEALLKLHFGGLSSASDVRALAEHQVAQHEERLRMFEGLQDAYGGQPDKAHQLTTLHMGRVLEHGSIAFWREVADRAEGLAAGRVERLGIALPGDRAGER